MKEVDLPGQCSAEGEADKLSLTTEIVANIVRTLEEDIALGLLHPRERLLEDELKVNFGAKRHHVRQALTELQRIGIVNHIKNRGAIVADMKPDEVVNIYAVRTLLEAAAVDEMELPMSKLLIEHLITIQDKHERSVAEKDHRATFRYNLQFHKLFFSACRNRHLSDAIETFSAKVHGVRFYSIMNPKYLKMACDEHWKIIKAAKDGDRVMLRRLCEQHLTPSMQFYIETYEMRFPTHADVRRG